MSEIEKIIKRYKSRDAKPLLCIYSLMNPAALYAFQERQRVLVDFFKTKLKFPLNKTTVLEVGCGSGVNLLELISLGFSSKNISGNELLPNRIEQLKLNLPSSCEILEGDACLLSIKPSSFDLVYQSTVFTSLLDDTYQEQLASKMWLWVKPGGAILWYDFIYNNPNNPDVRGISLKRIKELFPEAQISFTRCTLAPPISRRVTKIHPIFYTILNTIPFLRTHVVCWISKENDK